MEANDALNSCSQLEPKSTHRKKKKMVGKGKKEKLASGKPKMLKKKAKQATSNTANRSESIKRKRTGVHDIYDDVEAKFTVMEKAERVFSSLSCDTPCFLKCMLPSNVTYSFWLIIPKSFCSLHLPSHDSTVILVDEWGKEFKTTYLTDRHGLSAGWRGFSMSHRLLKGDILIFDLIEPCRFKVHIVRVNGLDVVNAALCLMSMDAFGIKTESDLAKHDNGKRKRTKKYAETTILDAPRISVKVEEKSSGVLASNLVTLVDESETSSDDLCSEVLQGAKIPDRLITTDHHFTEAAFKCGQPCDVVTCR